MSQKSDPVRPGEQWFCYWKTSAALWEQKIREIPAHEIVFIPVFWGFHADQGQSWDFGQREAERDLGRLVHLLTQHGRTFCWLLPLTPAPFLPNGGIPISAARTFSTADNGIQLAAFDLEGVLHKMYSFYEAKVFQSFGSFLPAFGNFLAQLKYKAPVWGTHFSFIEDGREISFLHDSSVAFEQGFSRYLKKTHPQGLELTDPAQETQLKASFRKEVRDLFTSYAAEILAPFWAGEKDIAVLGAGPRDTLMRGTLKGRAEIETFNDIFASYVRGRWFSSVLLSNSEKKDLTQRCLAEHFGKDQIEHQFRYTTRDADHDFRPLGLIEVFAQSDAFKTNGLLAFLDRHFRWMYGLRAEMEFTPEAIDASTGKVKFFSARGMDRTHFSQMLKLFMMGERIVFDRSGLAPELDQRLQIFLLENNLKVQMVNFVTSVSLCELGEGRFISIEGDRLGGASEQLKFWGQLFNYFKLHQPRVAADDDIFALWRIRATASHELNYLDVRRVNLYNPTSYKKSVHVQTLKKFAFLKLVDPVQASAKSTPEGVEVEILPNGRIALDFGHYEEK